MSGFKKFDTYATTTYLVKLAMDPKVYAREPKSGQDDKGEDVVLTFCDNSRIDGTEEMWVDARLSQYNAELGKKMKKGDVVQLTGKLRFKKDAEGKIRGKIYDARLATLAGFDRQASAGNTESPPAFE